MFPTFSPCVHISLYLINSLIPLQTIITITMIQNAMSEQNILDAIQTLTHSVNGTNTRLDEVIKRLAAIHDSVFSIDGKT